MIGSVARKRRTRARIGTAADAPVDEKPRSVYEVVTRRMLEELREDVGEVKSRLNTLLWLVAGAVVLNLALRLMGG